MPSKLPPLSDEVFDGEKQKTELVFQRCKHKEVKFVGGMLRCKCGNSWGGPNLHELYKLLREIS